MRNFFGAFGVVLVLLALLLSCALRVEESYRKSGAPPPLWAQLLASAAKGSFGAGEFAGKPNNLDLSLLQPGDILLAGNAGGSYGHFTHAGLYVGGGKVTEMYLSTGVYLAEAEIYHDYDWAAILRVKATPAQRRAAVAYAEAAVGEPFFILTPKAENGLWYCTKLIWRAYYTQGIDLDTFKSFWVLPDSFWRSPHVEVVAYARAR